jgi:hypothetical protein
MFTAIAHKNLADAGIVFDGRRLRNSSPFPVASIGHRRRKFPNAFCVPDTPLPVCLRVRLQFDGRINVRDKKTLCFILKRGLLKTS